MSDLMKLAERVEGLTAEWAPEYRSVAKEIYRAINGSPDIAPSGYGWKEDDSGWWMLTGEDGRIPPKRINPPEWLTSLDAARQLVPDTCLFWCRELWDDQRKAGFAGVNIYRDMMHAGEIHGLATTPALALTAAALKARAHLEGE